MNKKICTLLLTSLLTVAAGFSAGAEEYYNIAYNDSKNAAVTVKGCLGTDAASKDITINIKRNGTIISSAAAVTDYRGCYETELDFQSDLSSCEVTVGYDSSVKTAEIKHDTASDMNVRAHITPENIICVEGFSAAKNAGDRVNILLVNKSSAAVGNFDLSGGAHIGDCAVDKTGHFLYKFTFGGDDISSYRLLVCAKGGSPQEITIDETQSARAIISLSLKDDNGNRAALNGSDYTYVKALVDSRRSGKTKANLLAAYYEETGRLIGVTSRFNYNFDFGANGVITVDDFLPEIPSDAQTVKLMVWEDETLEPYGAYEKYSNSEQAETEKYFYVAPDGSDFNDGNFDSPLATLTAAKCAVNEYIEAKGMPENGITVRFRGGTYPISDTVEFTAADSGTASAPITYEAYNGEQVIFDGGVHIPSSAFSPVANTTISSRIPSGNAVYCVDLKQFGIYDFGDGGEKLYQANYIPDLEVFSKGEPMVTARYPNVNSEGEQQYLLSGTNTNGDDYSLISYTDETLENAASFDGAFIEGWIKTGYEYNGASIVEVDKDNNTFKIGYNGTSSNEVRYFINNLPEALDSPGEYYLDRGTGLLYIIPNGSISDADITVSVFGKNVSQPVIKTNGASYINFKGFTITDCRAGGICIYGGNDISVDSCEIKNVGHCGIIVGSEKPLGTYLTVNGVNVYSSSFYNTGYEKSSGHSITNSKIYNVGEKGVKLAGGDRINLVGADFTLSNCELHDCGRIIKSAPTVNAVGVGITISNNDIYNAACAGITMGGNEIIIENNEFYNCANETTDYGTIYSCGYEGAEIQAGSEIRYNYFHDVPREVKNIVNGSISSKPHRPAVYNDYCDPFLDVHHNYFENMPIGCFNGSGWENNWTDNVFKDADIPMLVQWNNGLYTSIEEGNNLDKLFDSLSTTEYKMLNVESGIWKEKYPKVAEAKEKMKTLTGAEATYPNSDIKNNIAFFLTEQSQASLEKISAEPQWWHTDAIKRTKYLNKIISLQHYPNTDQNKFLKDRGIDTNVYTDNETETSVSAALAGKGIVVSEMGVK